MRQRNAAPATTVEQLLSSTTFLGGLSEAERASIFGGEPRHSSPVRHTGTHTPRADAAALAGATAAASWEACLNAAEAQHCSPSHPCSPNKQQLLLLQHLDDLNCRQQQHLQQHRPAATCAGNSNSPNAVYGWDEVRQQSHVLLADNEQLLRDNKLLQKHKEQLQAKVTGLQNQVTLLLAGQRSAAEGSSKLAALEGAVGRLQASLSHISAMAAKAAQENKVLLCQNQQLAAERERMQEALQQLKARAWELEADLLAKVAASSQDAAEAAAAASPPLLSGSVCLMGAVCNSSSLAAGSAASGKIGPALQEISVLKRSQHALQREAARLQQQLSAAERDAQAAAAAAAAERARAARNAGQGQHKLAAAMQRLEAASARAQQQAATLQEREEYIARLEQCLLGQHEQLSQLAIAASKSRHADAVAAAAGLAVQLPEVARPPAAVAKAAIDGHLSGSPRAVAAAFAVAGEAPGGSSRPGTPAARGLVFSHGVDEGTAAADAAAANHAAGRQSPANSIAETLKQQQHQKVQLDLTLTTSRPGHISTAAAAEQYQGLHCKLGGGWLESVLMQQHAAAESGSSHAAAAAAAARAAVAKQCRDAQLRASCGGPGSGAQLSPAAAAAAAASHPSKESPRQAQLHQPQQFTMKQHGVDIPQDSQQQQHQLKGLQQLQNSKLQHYRQQRQQHHSAGSLRRTVHTGGSPAKSAAGAATTTNSIHSTLKAAAGSGSTIGIRRGNGRTAQGTTAGKGGSPVAAAPAASAAAGTHTSQLHQLHMQRQRRLRDLLQQKQQRQQQRLQPGLGQQAKRRQPPQTLQQQQQQQQQQQVEDDMGSDEELEPYASERAVPAPVSGMRLHHVRDPFRSCVPTAHQQSQRDAVQEPSLAAGLGLAVGDVAATGTISSLCHSSGMQTAAHSPQAAAPSNNRSCCSPPTAQQLLSRAGSPISPRCRSSSMQAAAHSPAASTRVSCCSPPTAQQLQSSAAATPARLSPAQLSFPSGDAGQEDEESAAYEARLVAKVLEVERGMQALESQLMAAGCRN